MRDFIKWLGVNEGVAKVAVWLLIMMVFLILTNTLLNSLGFPYYAITQENIKRIDLGKAMDLVSRIVVCIINFYAIILLIFKSKEIKKLLKWSFVYLVLNWIVSDLFGYGISQIFIIIFIIIFSYLYSSKNKKYIFYSIIAIMINIIIEAITYYFKGSLIDISKVNSITSMLLSIDYFIIMGIIILVKEIYIKKRGEKNEGRTRKLVMGRRVQKRKQTSKETSKKSK